jgi:transcriptional regulator with XRE-family HTH domain
MMNRLKEVREQKRLSQYELGRLLGKYQSWVWQVENGYHEPDKTEKEAIVKILDVDVNEIFPSNP